MRRFLKAIGVVLLAAAALVVVSVLHFMIYGPPQPTWSDDAIVEIRIEELAGPGDATVKAISVGDPQRIRAILAALKPRTPGPPHKCADRATMLLTKRDGETVRLRLLPGHDCDYYEVGVEGWRAERVERKAFLAAFKAAGVDWLPEECGQ